MLYFHKIIGSEEVGKIWEKLLVAHDAKKAVSFGGGLCHLSIELMRELYETVIEITKKIDLAMDSATKEDRVALENHRSFINMFLGMLFPVSLEEEDGSWASNSSIEKKLLEKRTAFFMKKDNIIFEEELIVLRSILGIADK